MPSTNARSSRYPGASRTYRTDDSRREGAGQLVGTWAGEMHREVDLNELEALVCERHLKCVAVSGWDGATGTGVGEIVDIVDELQRVAEETRLGIPLFFQCGRGPQPRVRDRRDRVPERPRRGREGPRLPGRRARGRRVDHRRRRVPGRTVRRLRLRRRPPRRVRSLRPARRRRDHHRHRRRRLPATGNGSERTRPLRPATIRVTGRAEGATAEHAAAGGSSRGGGRRCTRGCRC